MTDKLRAACIALLKSAPDHIINEHWPELDEIVKALAELEQPVSFYVYEWINPSDGTVFRSFRHDEHHMGREPDRTIAFQEPDTGIDRGAWADVPDATKWVDDLRGDEPETITATELAKRIKRGEKWKLAELPNSVTGVVERKTTNETPKARPVAHMNRDGWITYGNAPGYDIPLYTAPPKSEWQGLTREEKTRIRGSVPYTQFMSAGEYAMKVQHATEAELREKNI